MNKLVYLIITCLPFICFGQSNQTTKYEMGLDFFTNSEFDSSYVFFKGLESSIDESDTLYEYALWYYIMSTSQLESKNRSAENFDQSLAYGLEALKGIEKGKKIFDGEFAEREYFMLKNIMVSQYGLGNYKKGKKLKAKMYAAHKREELPKSLENYFNYDFFTFEDKNIWGYEWFAEMPKNRYGSSFTKVVYYVYSTNPDGSDKDQLYRLHVLMFHGDGKAFDYVLDKKLNTATSETSGTMYAYTYQEDIDFEKLKLDVLEIVKGNVQSDTKRVTKKESGKTDVIIEID